MYPKKRMAQIWGYVDHSGAAVSGMHAILRGQILHANSGNFKMGFSYSFNAYLEGIESGGWRTVPLKVLVLFFCTAYSSSFKCESFA